MTEPTAPSDGEIAQFLEGEEQRAARNVGMEAMLATANNTIIDALDRAGAFRLYDPDPEQIERRAEAFWDEITLLIERGEDIDIDEAERTALVRFSDEDNMVAHMRIILYAKQSGYLKPDIEMKMKKQLHAELMVMRFDEHWTTALDELVDGPLLDLSKDEDKAIYAEAGYKILSPEPNPVVDKVLAILVPNESDGSDYSEEKSEVVSRLCTQVFLALEFPARKPDAESFIHSAQAAGIIDEGQRTALLDMLNNAEEARE